MNNTERFNKYWEKFATRVKGKLLRHAEKQPLTYPLAKLDLSDAVLDWGSEYDEGGRWLMELEREDPARAKRIRHILMEKLCFTELPAKAEVPDALNYVVPVAGAAVGWGLSSFFQARMLIQAVSTVAPAVLLYPATKTMGGIVREKNQRNGIEEYMAQLEPFKAEILSILAGRP